MEFFCACTILGFARAVVRLRQVALHAAAGVGAICISAGLTASTIYCALVKICHRKDTVSYGAHTLHSTNIVNQLTQKQC